MKITYVVEDFSMCGGVERIVSRKAGILSSEYGHEVTIISVYEDLRPIRYSVDKSVKTVFLNVPMAKKSSNAATTTINRITTLFKAVTRMNKALKEINPDVIFFTTTLGALLLPFCHVRAKKVYESHLARIFNPYNTFFMLTERCADMVVCLTNGDAAEYRHAKNVKVIPNFIEKPSSTVKDYNVKKAVAVGRLEEQKGFDILIDIWKDVAVKHPDWQLHIYGEGPLQQELQRQIDLSGLKEKVILQGSCTNMIERYTDYSLHVMTSRYEGLPMTLIEAQAAGLPSIVFDFKYGARDIIINETNGLIIKQGDTTAFTDALCKVMDNKDIRINYGKNASKLSSGFFENNIMPEWEKTISELRIKN